MFRALIIVLMAVAPAAADAPLPLAKFVEIEFTERDPIPNTIRGSCRGKIYQYAIQPGERFRIEMEVLGDVDASFRVLVEKEVAARAGQGRYANFEAAGPAQKKLDFTLAKAPPGKSVQITVASPELCRARVRITKIGADGKPVEGPSEVQPLGVSLEDRIRKLEAENAELKRRLNEIEKRLGFNNPMNPGKP